MVVQVEVPGAAQVAVPGAAQVAVPGAAQVAVQAVVPEVALAMPVAGHLRN